MADTAATKRPPPTIVGIIGGIVLGLVAALLIVNHGDTGTKPTGPLPVTNAAYNLVNKTVDCADPRGTRAEGGIPVEVPSGDLAEVRITCGALGRGPQDWKWVREREPHETADIGQVRLFGDRLNFGVARDGKPGEILNEITPEGDQAFRPGSNSDRVLAIRFIVGTDRMMPFDIDCASYKQGPYYGVPEPPPQAQISVPYSATGVTVNLKCGALAENRWKFATGNAKEQSDTGYAVFTSPATMRLFKNRNAPKSGRLFTFVTPVSGNAQTENNRIEIVFYPAPLKIFGMGDSWTAAFGFYGNGNEMPLATVAFCRPGSGVLNDRCSSNSDTNEFNASRPLIFSDDYGLGNNISWVAQVTNAIAPKGAFEYQNIGVSGAEPGHFLPGGVLESIMYRVVSNNPDLTLMTLGGNPMLGDVLGGIADCESSRGEPGQGTDALRQCAERLIDSKYKVVENLQKVYTALLQAPNNHVVVSSYMAIVPYHPGNNYNPREWTALTVALNGAIARAVTQTKAAVPQAAARLYLVPPLTVATGEVRPDGVGTKCKRGNSTFWADGSSVLTPQTQDVLLYVAPGANFCGHGASYEVNGQWRDAGTEVWFNPGDVGTHLSRLGNQQLANAAIALIRGQKILGLAQR